MQQDGFGGGTNVTNNLIYNQCRESGGEHHQMRLRNDVSLGWAFTPVCRCTGISDHGAMNSWDRTAYISDVKYGTPSYEAQMNNVNNNFSAFVPSSLLLAVKSGIDGHTHVFIQTHRNGCVNVRLSRWRCNRAVIANYGASQGFDTDDGSSWYDIHDNFFFMADAWKM